MDASVYMAASCGAVQQHTVKLVRQAGFDLEPEERTGAMAISPGAAARIKVYEELAQDKQLIVDGQWKINIALVNVSQNCKYFRSIDTEVAAPLMRNSVFVRPCAVQTILAIRMLGRARVCAS